MATHDYVIANQGFPAFRSDLNNALAAIVSNNSSATEPTTMFAHMIWVDTAANPSILKMRNADNDAWVTLARIDQTNDRFVLVGPQYLNRLSTDGDVAIIQKDGTTVGAIGSSSGELFIGSPSGTDSFIRMGGSGIYPATSAGANRDNEINLGDPSARFQHLYLGGSVYLGGTSAANALDDYEEGTWIPTAQGGTTAGTTTYTLQQGSYTKIGRLVIASARLGYSALTGTGEFQLGGLPFTSAADSMEYMSSIMTQFLNWSGNTSLALYVGQNITHASIFISGDDVGWLAQQCVNESADFRFTAIYFTA